MAAAIASLQLCKDNQAASSVMSKGKLFCDQLESISHKFGVPLKMTGLPSMPYPWIEGDEDLYQIQSLCKLAAKHGLYFHPHHNWFISDAMTETEINQSLSLS